MMKQASMDLGADPIGASDATDECERDLFGQPIKRPHTAAPTYRPRAPKQQALNLAPATFKLG